MYLRHGDVDITGLPSATSQCVVIQKVLTYNRRIRNYFHRPK